MPALLLSEWRPISDIMTSLARLLLLVAALAYGAMPMTGMSAVAMPVAHAMDTAGTQPAAASTKAMADVDCPHSGSQTTVADAGGDGEHPSKPVKTAWHCAACLTLPAHPGFADGGKPASAAEAGLLIPTLVSQMAAPLTPPPRA